MKTILREKDLMVLIKDKFPNGKITFFQYGNNEDGSLCVEIEEEIKTGEIK